MENKKTRMIIGLFDSQKEAIAKIAKEQYCSQTHIVREAVKEYIQKYS